LHENNKFEQILWKLLTSDIKDPEGEIIINLNPTYSPKISFEYNSLVETYISRS